MGVNKLNLVVCWSLFVVWGNYEPITNHKIIVIKYEKGTLNRERGKGKLKPFLGASQMCKFIHNPPFTGDSTPNTARLTQLPPRLRGGLGWGSSYLYKIGMLPLSPSPLIPTPLGYGVHTSPIKLPNSVLIPFPRPQGR
jgi:hypothetical protein